MRRVVLLGSVLAAIWSIAGLSQGTLVEPEKSGALTAPARQDALIVIGSRVNVRAAPSLDGAILMTFAKGHPVTVSERRDGWSKVALSDGTGRTGWVSSQFLGTSVPAAPQYVAQPAPRQRTVAVPGTREINAARKDLIAQSRAAYPGSCPCPYDRDRAGRKCGGRSAWSRKGGYSPLCYDSDVSEARIKSHIARKRGATY